MRKLILFALTTYSVQSFSAALIELNESAKTLTMTSHIVYYGKGASNQVAQFCTNEIHKEWSALSQNQYVQLGARNQVAEGNYKIIFKLSHEIMDAKKAKKLIKQSDDRTFRIFQNNYIDVPKNTNTDRIIYGGNIFDGSTGSIYDQAALFDFKVCAHEFGHLLGLGEMNDTSSPPTLMTQGGKETPYKEYQIKTYDPRFFEMSVGTFDVRLRKISQREIDETKKLIQYLYFKNSTAVLNCRTCMLD